jgi:hypothetical protein
MGNYAHLTEKEWSKEKVEIQFMFMWMDRFTQINLGKFFY